MDHQEQRQDEPNHTRRIKPVNLDIISNPPCNTAHHELTKNIVAKLINDPTAAVHQVKNLPQLAAHSPPLPVTTYLNVGLKFGALPIFSKKQAIFVTQKVIRYVIVTKLAIVLISANNVNCASRKVNKMPIVGSSCSTVPWPNIDKPGKISSLARACSDFADPITPMSAEKKEVANSPMRIRCGDKLIYSSQRDREGERRRCVRLG